MVHPLVIGIFNSHSSPFVLNSLWQLLRLSEMADFTLLLTHLWLQVQLNALYKRSSWSSVIAAVDLIFVSLVVCSIFGHSCDCAEIYFIVNYDTRIALTRWQGKYQSISLLVIHVTLTRVYSSFTYSSSPNSTCYAVQSKFLRREWSSRVIYSQTSSSVLLLFGSTLPTLNNTTYTVY